MRAMHESSGRAVGIVKKREQDALRTGMIDTRAVARPGKVKKKLFNSVLLASSPYAGGVIGSNWPASIKTGRLLPASFVLNC